MVLKKYSTKNQTPKEASSPPTHHLRNEATSDESSGSVEEYPIAGEVDPRTSLP